MHFVWTEVCKLIPVWFKWFTLSASNVSAVFCSLGVLVFIQIVFQQRCYPHSHSLGNEPITLLLSQVPPPRSLHWLVGNGCGVFIHHFLHSVKHPVSLWLSIREEVNISCCFFLFCKFKSLPSHLCSISPLTASISPPVYSLTPPLSQPPCLLSLGAVSGDGCGFCRGYLRSMYQLSACSRTWTDGSLLRLWDIWDLLITAFILCSWTDFIQAKWGLLLCFFILRWDAGTHMYMYSVTLGCVCIKQEFDKVAGSYYLSLAKMCSLCKS